MFDADRPITNSAQDKLNRTLFAKNLARCMLGHKDPNSFVVGLYGGWGTGKTSLLNLTLEELHAAGSNMLDEEKPIVLNFSPWSYSGQDLLIYNFFRRLSSTLRNVPNLQNGKQVIVRVNDRGPFAANRIIDLSYVAARKLGYYGHGTALVQVTSIDVPNPLRNNQQYFAHHTPHLYLQVGAFANIQNAERLEARIKHVTADNTRIVRGKLYRVQIGPLKGVAESDYLQERIERDGLGHAITMVG